MTLFLLFSFVKTRFLRQFWGHCLIAYLLVVVQDFILSVTIILASLVIACDLTLFLTNFWGLSIWLKSLVCTAYASGGNKNKGKLTTYFIEIFSFTYFPDLAQRFAYRLILHSTQIMREHWQLKNLLSRHRRIVVRLKPMHCLLICEFSSCLIYVGSCCLIPVRLLAKSVACFK